MNRKFRFYGVMAILLAIPVLFLEAQRSWEAVETPTISSIAPKASDPKKVVVQFKLVTGNEGADNAKVEMYSPTGQLVESKLVGRSRRDIKDVEFEPTSSGTYSFRVAAFRKDVEEGKFSQSVEFVFTLPLQAPQIRAKNLGGGVLQVSWAPVQEATDYELVYTKLGTGVSSSLGSLRDTTAVLQKLDVGHKYELTVTALRGEERNASDPLGKTVRAEAERDWKFTYFGQSSKGELNRIEMVDADAMVFKLYSCTYNKANDQIDQKGGKFTAFHDGISYYYTEIDPRRENFELCATFTIDYINPIADGQEGFGLLAMDSLGAHGVSSVNHYTNSAGIIATKFEEVIAGIKKTSKDTLGARFVSGITPQVIALGDAGIAEHGRSIAHAYSYAQSDLVKAGDVYDISLKKTNTGYHASFAKEYADEETITEYIMYGPEKLLQIDKDRIYVGFAVARGCNATVSNVRFTVTNPASDPPAQEEPPELVPLTAKVDSPSTYHDENYPFVFTANADGKLSVKANYGEVLVQDAPVFRDMDFTSQFKITRGINDFIITFTPNPGYRPEPKQVMAAYDRELQRYVESYAPVTITYMVVQNSYPGSNLYAGPGASPFGKGTKADPLDLDSAVKYVRPGQTIILLDGTYRLTKPLIIERGNSGSASQRKLLRSEEGARAVLDFSNAGGGMQLWGDYWTLFGFDVCRTSENVKGLQVAGDKNIIEGIVAYRCGDTGIQISGTSAETWEKWPRNNLVLNCTSYDNCDPAANNADGFAAKLTCAEGNVFRGCLAYGNIDDGWDLFSKIESGPIGAVLIENCVAFGNGSLSDKSVVGDGNGFKLGGDGIAIPHILRNSIAYANLSAGITSNSNPSVIVEKVISYGNGGRNLTLYGKGGGERYFKLRDIISMDGAEADDIREQPGLAGEGNFLWTGAECVDGLGRHLEKSIFVSTDTGTIPGRMPDGSIDMKELLVLQDGNPAFIKKERYPPLNW